MFHILHTNVGDFNWLHVQNREEIDTIKMIKFMIYDLLEAGIPGLEVIKLEYSLKIKRNDWLFADMCLQTANHCASF